MGHVINLVVYSDIGNHWIAVYAFNNNVTYFDSFEVEHIPNKNNKNTMVIKTLWNLRSQIIIFLEYKHLIQ